MSKDCPIKGKAIYLDCIECEEKECKKSTQYDQIIIGIDQSYKRTGVTVIVDSKIKVIRSKDLLKYKSKSNCRRALRNFLDGLLRSIIGKAKNITCIIERIRLRSQGFININYIKSIGALNATIVDLMSEYNIPVYSVDTRCWKATVIGTSKPESNNFGVPEEKWPTVRWVCDQGFKSSILLTISTRKTKGTFTRKGKKYMFDNDAADSCGIAMFGVIGDKNKLELET